MIDIVSTITSAPLPENLWGANIELPAPGSRIRATAFTAVGWVLAREHPAIAVEFVQQGHVILRVPISVKRPDIAAAFPNVAGADLAGFQADLPLLRGELNLALRAVLNNQDRAAFGFLEAQRHWDERSYAVGVALVSVLVFPANDMNRLNDTLQCIVAQTYPHLEIIVAYREGADEIKAVAARFPGLRLIQMASPADASPFIPVIRQCSGSYVVIVDPLDRLHPDALKAGLARLKENPNAGAVCGRLGVYPHNGATASSPEHSGLYSRSDNSASSAEAPPRLSQVMFRRVALAARSQLKSRTAEEFYRTVARDFEIHHYKAPIAW